MNLFYKQLIILILIFNTLSVSAEKKESNIKINNAQKTSMPTVEDTVDYYLAKAYEFSPKNSKIHLQYIDSAARYINHVSDSTIIATFYSNYGLYYTNTGNFDSSLYYYKKVLNYINISQLRAYTQTHNNIGNTFSKIDQYDSTLYHYNISIQLIEQLDSSKRTKMLNSILANTYNSLGSLHLNMGAYDKSLDYYYKALKIYEDYNARLKSSIVLLNIGNIYLLHKEYEKALSQYRKSISIINDYPGRYIRTRASLLTNIGSCYKEQKLLDTALEYYNKALNIRLKTGPSRSISGLYDNLGNIEKAKHHFDKAMHFYTKALDIRKKDNRPRELAASYGNIGLLYTEKNPKKAINYLEKAINISDKNSFIEISIACKQGLSQAYSNLGDYKRALEYYVNYRELNDSIHSLRLEEKLSEYKQKYESEKKDRLIQHLEEDKKLADALDKKQKLINEKQRITLNALIGVAVLLLIILIILQRYFKMKRESDRELFEKTEQINQQKTMELMKELEMSSFKSFMEGQEKERARIAGDLHDRLGSLLSTVRLHFDSLNEALADKPDAKANHEFALKLLDNSVQEVRAVSHNLTKGVLTQFGLIAAVENMSDAINAAGKIQMEVFSHGVTSRLDSEVEINLFRVIQELITNVIRHAQTNEVFVQFTSSGSQFSVIVEDHGIGFDVDNTESKGIGMMNLKKRVEASGGSFHIDSKIGQGTTIIIEVPYIIKDEKEDEEEENNNKSGE